MNRILLLTGLIVITLVSCSDDRRTELCEAVFDDFKKHAKIGMDSERFTKDGRHEMWR